MGEEEGAGHLEAIDVINYINVHVSLTSCTTKDTEYWGNLASNFILQLLCTMQFTIFTSDKNSCMHHIGKFLNKTQQMSGMVFIFIYIHVHVHCTCSRDVTNQELLQGAGEEAQQHLQVGEGVVEVGHHRQ